MEVIPQIMTVLGLLVIAVPLCVMAIGLHRLFQRMREFSRSPSLVKNEKSKAPKELSHADAARARALARQDAREAERFSRLA